MAAGRSGQVCQLQPHLKGKCSGLQPGEGCMGGVIHHSTCCGNCMLHMPQVTDRPDIHVCLQLKEA